MSLSRLLIDLKGKADSQMRMSGTQPWGTQKISFGNYSCLGLTSSASTGDYLIIIKYSFVPFTLRIYVHLVPLIGYDLHLFVSISNSFVNQLLPPHLAVLCDSFEVAFCILLVLPIFHSFYPFPFCLFLHFAPLISHQFFYFFFVQLCL